jgi:hypothetical protein
MLRTLVKKCYASFFASGSRSVILDTVVLEHDDARVDFSHLSRVVDPEPDPYWIRIQSGLWIRIRIQEGKNDPQK